MFYNSYIAPHMDYCCTVWGSSSHTTRLLKLQKQAARIILNCDWTVSSKDMFRTLKWLPIHDWIKFRKACMVFKCINGTAPSYLCNMFKTVSSMHNRCTRQSCNNDLYLPPRAKLNIYRNSLQYSGAQIWNSLPTNIRAAPNLKVFKHKYLNHYINS